MNPRLTFCCFNQIPWTHLRQRPVHWPFPNDSFDPRLATDIYKSAIDQFVYAEKCGFDWLAVGEDHMSAYSLTPNPLLFMAVLSQCTEKVKLAILGLPLPLLNPIRAAEEVGMVDILSNGRLVVGLIRGVPQNYAAYHVDLNESRGRFDEAVQLMKKAWCEQGTFEWRGDYYHFPSVSLWPRPLQKPHPPIVFSANSPESAIGAAKQKAMIGAIHLYSPNSLDNIRKAKDAYVDQANEAGWQPAPDRFLIGLPTCIADSDAAAQSLLEPALQYHFSVLSGTYDAEKRAIAETKPGYGFTPVEENPPTLAERLACGIVLCGSPLTVINQIKRLRDSLGVGIISMHFNVGNMADAAIRTGIRLFRDHVRPAFK